MQGPEPETSREVRRVINAIHDLSELETQIPLCKTIDEVEDIRARCNGIQSYNRELLGPSLVAWARRVATLCQLRITELQVLAIAKRKKNSGDPLTPFEKETLERITNNSDSLTRSKQNRRSEQRAILSMPKEELTKQLDAGNTEPQKLARIARKMRGKKEPKGSPEKRAKDLERYYRKKAEQRSNAPTAPKRSPAQKFERYWPQEEKLLQQFFTGSDLSNIEAYWTRAFQSYRREVEEGTRERQKTLAKLKTTVRVQDDAMSEVERNAQNGK